MKFSWTSGIVSAALGFVIFLIPTPAFADGMTNWGVNGGGAPAMLSFGTKGIAFIIIWLIEALAFKIILKISLPRAILGSLALNLFSTLGGVIVALVAFSIPFMTWFAFTVFIVLTYRIYYVIGKIPQFYGPILLLSLLVGSIAAYSINNLVPPLHPIHVGFMMMLTLFTGYGLSVGLEALISGKVLGTKDSWNAILKANAISFIVLALMIPFFNDNIYSGNADVIEDKIVGMINDGAAEEEVVTIFRHYASSNWFTLGLSKDYKPTDDYFSSLEEDVILTLYTTDLDALPDPSIGLAITENALSYPELFDQSLENMTWAQKYFEGWLNVLEADESGEMSDFITASITWTTWYQTSDVPNDFEDIPEPNTILENLNK